MKEILSFYIGQAGVQTGSAVWELFCAEHNITYDGKLMDSNSKYECLETFFHESSKCSWVPRSLFVDLEPTVIDEIRNGSFKKLFHPDRLLNGPEDAANNFSRGFFTVGKLLLGAINMEFRHLIEQCDMTQGILIMRSLGGGTGAGLTSAMFESFDDHPKTPKIEIPIYPSPTLSTSMVEPYNCLLGEHFCMEDIDVGLLLDNEAMFDICSKYLTITYPTYNTINRLIAQVVSSITASVRFENVLNCDLTVLQTNMVPYPRIHFPLCNFAPIINQERANHQDLSVQELTRLVFERDNQMMKIDHFYGKFMSCALFYRGNVCPHHVYLALSDIKRGRTIEFVDWCPTGFKVGINAVCPVIVPDSKFADTKKNVAMLTNTSAIGQAWQRLTHRFYLLYSKRSFIHWFVGEGMEECEFTEALYNISALVKDYEEAGENTNVHGDEACLSKTKDDYQSVNSLGSPEKIDEDESIQLAVNERSASNSTERERWKTLNEMDEIEKVHLKVLNKEMAIRQPLGGKVSQNLHNKQYNKKGSLTRDQNYAVNRRRRRKYIMTNTSCSDTNDTARYQQIVNGSRFSHALKYLELTKKLYHVEKPELSKSETNVEESNFLRHSTVMKLSSKNKDLQNLKVINKHSFQESTNQNHRQIADTNTTVSDTIYSNMTSCYNLPIINNNKCKQNITSSDYHSESPELYQSKPILMSHLRQRFSSAFGNIRETKGFLNGTQSDDTKSNIIKHCTPFIANSSSNNIYEHKTIPSYDVTKIYNRNLLNVSKENCHKVDVEEQNLEDEVIKVNSIPIYTLFNGTNVMNTKEGNVTSNSESSIVNVDDNKMENIKKVATIQYSVTINPEQRFISTYSCNSLFRETSPYHSQDRTKSAIIDILNSCPVKAATSSSSVEINFTDHDSESHSSNVESIDSYSSTSYKEDCY